MRLLTITAIMTSLGFMGCDPLSTKDLGAQENAIQAEGQMAMQEQSGTVGNSSYSELESNVNMVKDPFDPDPFIEAQRQELASRDLEGTEVPGAEGEGDGTNPNQVNPITGNIDQP